MRRALSLTNVAARGLLEAGIVAASSWWGFTLAGATTARVVLAVLAPLAVFGFWGAVDFRFAGRHAETLRVVQELAVTGLVSAALLSAGQHTLSGMLLTLGVAHHVAVRLLGERLLGPRGGPAPARA